MGAPLALSIRPLGLGEIVDRSVALTLRRFRPLFLAMLVVQAPAVALARLQQGRALGLLAAAGDPARAAEALPGTAASLLGLLGVLLVLQAIATGAATALVAPVLDPRPAAPPPLARRALALATASAAQLLALSLAPALGAAPGLLLALAADGLGARLGAIAVATLGAITLLLVAVLRLALVPAIAAVEGIGDVRAALRSWRLMRAPRGTPLLERPGVRASLVLLATFLLAIALNGLAGVPRAVVGRLAGTPGPLGLPDVPLGADVALSVLEAVASAAVQPFSLVAVAVLYFERRARVEALDVEIWASRLEARP